MCKSVYDMEEFKRKALTRRKFKTSLKNLNDNSGNIRRVAENSCISPEAKLKNICAQIRNSEIVDSVDENHERTKSKDHVQSPIQKKMLSLDTSILEMFDLDQEILNATNKKQRVDDKNVCIPISEECNHDTASVTPNTHGFNIDGVDSHDIHAGLCSDTNIFPTNSPEFVVPGDLECIMDTDLTGSNEERRKCSISSSTMTSSVQSVNEFAIDSMIKKMLIKNAQEVHKLERKEVVREAKVSQNISSCDIGPFFGLPSNVKDLFKKFKGIEKLYSWQEECLNLKAVHERRNLVYSLPTSGGKTLVAEILILKELLCNKKNVIFVLPYVSIVQEKVRSFSAFALELNFLIEEYASNKGVFPPRKRRRKKSLYVATIEKALGLVNNLLEFRRLGEIGLVVVDELHTIGDNGGRGATLEGFLTKLLYSKEDIQLIGMSATIGNLSEIGRFLKAEIYAHNFRPVELKEYLKLEDSIFSLNSEAKCYEDLLIFTRKIEPSYTPQMASSDPDLVGALVTEVVPSHSCLVFCATKKNCENVALMIIKMMPRSVLNHKREEKLALYRALKSESNGLICPVLKKTLPFGVAYHHSGLTADERKFLEEAYLTGILCCICCTSTLAAGVNLPAKRVILRSPYVGCQFMELRYYKQMVGRAGRAGMDSSGESILICKPNEVQKVAEMLMSKMNECLSGLNVNAGKPIENLLLSVIGLGLATSYSELQDFVKCTLLHVQEEKLGISVKQAIDNALTSLFNSKAICIGNKLSSKDQLICFESEENIEKEDTCCKEKGQLDLLQKNGVLQISRLGRASIKGCIDLQLAHTLYKDLTEAQMNLVVCTPLHLLYLVTPYDMMQQIQPVDAVYYDSYLELCSKDKHAAEVLGISEACMVQMACGRNIKVVSKNILHRFYLTLILYDLWNQKTVWQVAEKYQLHRGLVQNLLTAAASFSSCVLHFVEELEEFWALQDIMVKFSQRLSYCCTAELLSLMELPAVKKGRAKQLYCAGYKTLQDVAKAEPDVLVNTIDHMPRKTAQQIVLAAKVLLLEKAETLRDEAEDLEGIIS